MDFSEFQSIALNLTNQVNETILEMMYQTIVKGDSNSNHPITIDRIIEFFQLPQTVSLDEIWSEFLEGSPTAKASGYISSKEHFIECMQREWSFYAE